MELIIEDEGITLLKNKEKYYLQYDAGAHMIKKKRIEMESGAYVARAEFTHDIYFSLGNKWEKIWIRDKRY